MHLMTTMMWTSWKSMLILMMKSEERGFLTGVIHDYNPNFSSVLSVELLTESTNLYKHTVVIQMD